MNKIFSLCTVLALTVSTSSAFAKDTLVVWEDEGRSSYISYGVRAFESAFKITLSFGVMIDGVIPFFLNSL